MMRPAFLTFSKAVNFILGPLQMMLCTAAQHLEVSEIFSSSFNTRLKLDLVNVSNADLCVLLFFL